MAMVEVEPIKPDEDDDEGTGRPTQRANNVYDYGMGDMLRHSAERLRIMLERHSLHTGSKRARAMLDDWDNVLKRFVKVMPIDYAQALRQLEEERKAADTVAAE